MVTVDLELIPGTPSACPEIQYVFPSCTHTHIHSHLGAINLSESTYCHGFRMVDETGEPRLNTQRNCTLFVDSNQSSGSNLIDF